MPLAVGKLPDQPLGRFRQTNPLQHLVDQAPGLFANWGNFVSPTIFGLAQSAQIIIWVIVGGRGTLIGPIVGCIGIQWLTTALGANQPSGGSDLWAKIFANAPLILGVILIAFVLLVPKGLVPTLGDLGQWLLSLRGKRAKTRLEPKQAEEG